MPLCPHKPILWGDGVGEFAKAETLVCLLESEVRADSRNNLLARFTGAVGPRLNIGLKQFPILSLA
jgi:hypothetical protein